jgi:hypothetical protein
MRSEDQSIGKHRSPWNIAVSFDQNMSLSRSGILEMLEEYKSDHSLHFDAEKMSVLLSDFTSGYPFLVSDLCAIMHTKLVQTKGFLNLDAAWTREGFLAALQILKSDNDLALFQSLLRQMEDSKELKAFLKKIVFSNAPVYYIAGGPAEEAKIHGFVSVDDDSSLRITNRIFETWLHTNLDVDDHGIADISSEINFIKDNKIDMELVLDRFSAHYNMLYKDEDKPSLENKAQLIFMTFLKPIINGKGFCHVGSKTKDKRETDLVIDYISQQEIVELKIWHGAQYNNDGVLQLADYLDKFNLDHGYLLVFSNLIRKEVKGRSEVIVKDKRIIIQIV